MYKIETQIDRANQVFGTQNVSNYAYMDDASKMTDVMLSEISGFLIQRRILKLSSRLLTVFIPTLKPCRFASLACQCGQYPHQGLTITGQAVANNIEGSTVRVFEYVDGVRQDLTITQGDGCQVSTLDHANR